MNQVGIKSDPTVQSILGGPIVLNIPFLSNLTTPTSLLTWIIALLAIMPWIVWIVCVFVILSNVIKWIRSQGNEKEIESAKTGIKRAVVGFASMFILFALANVMSFFFTGQPFEKLIGGLAPCGTVNYAFQFSRDANIPLDDAIEACAYVRSTGGTPSKVTPTKKP